MAKKKGTAPKQPPIETPVTPTDTFAEMINLLDPGRPSYPGMKVVPKLYGKEPLSDPELSTLEEIAGITKVPTRDLVFWYVGSYSLTLEGKKLESVPDSIGNLVRLKSLYLNSKSF
jgi:hypothetical protein